MSNSGEDADVFESAEIGSRLLETFLAMAQKVHISLRNSIVVFLLPIDFWFILPTPFVHFPLYPKTGSF